MPDSFWNHPIEKLEKALHIRKQIDALQQSLSELFGSTPQPRAEPEAVAVAPKRKGKRTRSPEVKARMAAAQRARWAKKSGEKPAAVEAAPVAKAKKGGMSAEGRARIITAQKLRWDKVRAEKSGSTTTKTPASKAPAVKAKRKISAAHRAKLAASAKARWAKVKKTEGKIANEGQPKFKIF